MRAPTVGALGEARRGEKAHDSTDGGGRATHEPKPSLQGVNEHFEPIFLVPRAGKRSYRGKWARAKISTYIHEGGIGRPAYLFAYFNGPSGNKAYK